jgi:hypothetical protein
MSQSATPSMRASRRQVALRHSVRSESRGRRHRSELILRTRRRLCLLGRDCPSRRVGSRSHRQAGWSPSTCRRSSRSGSRSGCRGGSGSSCRTRSQRHTAVDRLTVGAWRRCLVGACRCEQGHSGHGGHRHRGSRCRHHDSSDVRFPDDSPHSGSTRPIRRQWETRALTGPTDQRLGCPRRPKTRLDGTNPPAVVEELAAFVAHLDLRLIRELAQPEIHPRLPLAAPRQNAPGASCSGESGGLGQAAGHRAS